MKHAEGWAGASQLPWTQRLAKCLISRKGLWPSSASFFFSYKCLKYYFTRSQFFPASPGRRWHSSAVLWWIKLIFFAYPLLCLVLSLVTMYIQGAATRQDIVCSSGGKLNCSYERFKLFEFWLHLSPFNKPTSKIYFFSRAAPDFTLQSPRTLLWH